MFLITGGRGAVATHLTRLLLADGRPVRLASARPDALTPPDGVDAVRLDLTDATTFPDALSGVRSVFLYANPARIEDLIGDAHRAGVEHVVLLSSSSVLAPDAADDPLARSHLDVETALLASPLTVTILRPGSFASNAGAWAWPIRAGRPVNLPFPDAHTDPIHEKDVAEAAYAVLTDERHRGDAYTLTGPESLTFTQQLGRLAAVLGRPVSVGHVTRDAWKREMADYIPGHYADALLNWWESTVDRPVALTKTVDELTGHPALSFETWAADHAGEFRG